MTTISSKTELKAIQPETALWQCMATRTVHAEAGMILEGRNPSWQENHTAEFKLQFDASLIELPDALKISDDDLASQYKGKHNYHANFVLVVTTRLTSRCHEPELDKQALFVPDALRGAEKAIELFNFAESRLRSYLEQGVRYRSQHPDEFRGD